MQITQLRIAGFKSFVDPVEVAFEEGLTGVVGPNGCGKSNILEALRWAMGATSARAMRGGEMDDLIFSGSATRPSRERCEVTLTLDNSARTAPAELNDSDTLEIKRILRRGAGSTYKVNGRTVRAKDVQLLFADASTGANSPALVRQGQISELIASKPQNRRRILEEAAGIAGLNQRRHEAELKLRAALGNLEQLEQLIGEIDRQTASLKRQASKARKRKAMDAEAEMLETALTAWRWRSAVDEREQSETALQSAKRAVEDGVSKEAAATTAEAHAREQIAPLKEAETEAAGKLGALKIQMTQLDADKRANADDIKRLDADLARIVSDLSREHALREEAATAIARAKDRLSGLPEQDQQAFEAQSDALAQRHELTMRELADAEARADALSGKLATSKIEARTAQSNMDRESQRLADLTRQIDSISGDLEQLGDPTALESALSDTRTESDAAEKAAAAAAKQASKLEAAAKSAQTAAQKAAAPVDEPEKLVRTLEAEFEGLSRLLKDDGVQDEKPILKETRPDKGYERALAAALGDDLNAPRGKSSRHYWSINAGSADAPSLPDGVESLADLTDAPKELAPRLSQCGIVDAEDGPRLQTLLSPGQRLVSKAGDLWRWDGYVRTAKAPSSAAERLEQQARRDACEQEIRSTRKEADKLRKALERARATSEKAQEAARDAAGEAPRAAANASKAREAVLRAEQELERLFLRRSSLENNLARLEDDRAAAQAQFDAAKSALVEGPSDSDEKALNAARDAVQTARAKERDAHNAMSDFKREAERAVDRRRALERELKDWSRRESHADERLDALNRQRTDVRTRLDAAKSTPDELALKLDSVAEAVETAETIRQAAADTLADSESALREKEQALRLARDESSKARETFARMEVRLEAAQRREEEISQQAQSRFDCGLEPLEKRVAAAHPEQDIAEFDPKEAEIRLSVVKREIEALGPVNLEADAQLDEIASRMETQARERDDLTAAIAKLQEGVAALNKEGAARLVAAYKEVDAHFRSLFETLFQGGEAQLKLTESEDPLEAGLEIYACPPGKRLGALSLMSGGEQALTATALIFAVFLSRPAPICVLDEVDAPLDDANVDRYCRLLDEMRKRTDTRFVAITHNAVTMSRMDRLFGVTMQERGVSKLVSVDLQAAEQLAAAQ